jgi:hypothetical protein
VKNENIFAQAALSKICESTVDSLPRLRYAQPAHTGEVLIFENGQLLLAVNFWLSGPGY